MATQQKMDVKSKVKRRLESGRSITALQALAYYRCMRLAVYISRLRLVDGMKIKTEIIHRKGVQFAKYSLDKK